MNKGVGEGGGGVIYAIKQHWEISCGAGFRHRRIVTWGFVAYAIHSYINCQYLLPNLLRREVNCKLQQRGKALNLSGPFRISKGNKRL